MRSLLLMAALVAVALMLGCSGSGRVKTYPVQGRIMYEGKPMVGGGAISLIPLTDQKGKTAAGMIRPDGSYTLGTYEEADGSMAGDFRVVIVQETVKEGQAAPDGSGPSTSGISTVAPADRIPLVYASDRDSPLTAKIEPKANEINFELKKH
jgi:hypothetical protein